MRKNMYNEPEFERKLRQCGNLSDIRKLLEQDLETNVKLLKESCEPTITLIMKDIFGRLKLKDIVTSLKMRKCQLFFPV